MAANSSRLVNLRMDEQLRTEAKAAAKREGTTFSALMRRAVRRELQDAR